MSTWSPGRRAHRNSACTVAAKAFAQQSIQRHDDIAKADSVASRSDSKLIVAQFRMLYANPVMKLPAITGIDKQIQLQQIRVNQAQKRFDMEQASLDQVEETGAFYHDKYTSAEFLTLDLASQAETAYGIERGLLETEPQPFIEGGYRNSSRDVSLRQVNPLALAKLRTSDDSTTGDFWIPETLWDMDFPSHSNRCINLYRINDGNAVYIDASTVHSSRIAVSSAQSDPGVFRLDVGDERYCPSKMPTTCNNPIGAQDGLGRVKITVENAPALSLDSGLGFYSDIRAEYSTAWAAFPTFTEIQLFIVYEGTIISKHSILSPSLATNDSNSDKAVGGFELSAGVEKQFASPGLTLETPCDWTMTVETNDWKIQAKADEKAAIAKTISSLHILAAITLKPTQTSPDSAVDFSTRSQSLV
ncbi:hypothetical protein HJFPF1_12972 [Paramyrothecium foliicola]|nr:hypothetical protein HJFPF1_12972 [Paramyrothecium foliicola]